MKYPKCSICMVNSFFDCSVNRLLVLLVAIAAPSTALSQLDEAPELLAELEPAEFRAGEFASYNVEVKGGHKGEAPLIWLPETFRAANPVPTASDDTYVVQGVIVHSTRLTWRITSNKPGEFVIPAQRFSVSGRSLLCNSVIGKVTSPNQQFVSPLSPDSVVVPYTKPHRQASTFETIVGVVVLCGGFFYIGVLILKGLVSSPVFRRWLAILWNSRSPIASFLYSAWPVVCLLVLLWLLMWPPWVQIGRQHVEVSLGMHAWWDRPKFGQVETQRWLAQIGATCVVFGIGWLLLKASKWGKTTG
jgi:hypothetical protein